MALLALRPRDGVTSRGGHSEDLLARAGLTWIRDEPRHAAEAALERIADGGWERAVRDVDGTQALRSVGARARLGFFAGARREGRVRLRLRTVAEASARLSASLNGSRLELEEVDDDWRTVDVPAPAGLWVEGWNVLDLELTPNAPGSADAPRLALAEFTLLRETSRPEANSWAAGDGLEVDLARLANASLDLAARADGDGLFMLELSELEPATGRTAAIVWEREVTVEGGESVETTFDLGDVLDGLHRLTLRWRPDDDASTATLDRLHLARSPDDAPGLVLFLSADTLAARSMSLHGYERDTTPELRALAERSLVFDRASANSGWTLPSYASQLSGLLPGALEFESIDPLGAQTAWATYQIPRERLTLAEVFAAAGYDTAAVIDSTMLENLQGVRQGFASFDASPASIPPTEPSGGMERAAELVLERIDGRDPERPLFVFLQVVDVHGPYLSRAPWDERFESEQEGPQIPVVPNTVKAAGTVHRYIAEGLVPDARTVAVEPLRSAYDAKVLELDERIGSLIDALEQRGLFDESLFVLSADHGEAMDEGGLYFRHGTAQDAVTHVPLLLKLPGDARAGERIDTRVALVDLLPTLAETLGLDPRPFESHGRSLFDTASDDRRPVVIETDHLKQRAIVRGRWKLVVSQPWSVALATDPLFQDRYWHPWAATFPDLAAELAGAHGVDSAPPFDPSRVSQFVLAHPEVLQATRTFFSERGPDRALYDLETDPDELFDLALEHPERVAELSELLEIALAANDEARTAVGSVPAPSDFDAGDLERLAELGYLDAATGDSSQR